VSARASDFRDPEFGRRYGLTLVDGPIAVLLARAVVVTGADGTVKYTQLVGEIADEPDYDKALAAIA
jgi:thiol peroxidase